MLGALFGFNGRLSRAGFCEVLASVVLVDAALLIAWIYVADSGLPGGYGPQSSLAQNVVIWAPWAAAVFTLWSLLAAMIKRSHDRGRSAASVFWLLVPVIGWLWLVVDLFLLAGTRGKNRYGGAPHGPDPDSRPAFNWSADPSPVAATAPLAPAPAHAEVGPPPESHSAPAAPEDHHSPDAIHAGEHDHHAHDHGHDVHPNDSHAHAPPSLAEPDAHGHEAPATHAQDQHAPAHEPDDAHAPASDDHVLWIQPH